MCVWFYFSFTSFIWFVGLYLAGYRYTECHMFFFCCCYCCCSSCSLIRISNNNGATFNVVHLNSVSNLGACVITIRRVFLPLALGLRPITKHLSLFSIRLFRRTPPHRRTLAYTHTLWSIIIVIPKHQNNYFIFVFLVKRRKIGWTIRFGARQPQIFKSCLIVLFPRSIYTCGQSHICYILWRTLSMYRDPLEYTCTTALSINRIIRHFECLQMGRMERKKMIRNHLLALDSNSCRNAERNDIQVQFQAIKNIINNFCPISLG